MQHIGDVFSCKNRNRTSIPVCYRIIKYSYSFGWVLLVIYFIRTRTRTRDKTWVHMFYFLINSFIRPFVRLYDYSFVRSFIHSFIHLFVRLFVISFVCPSVRQLFRLSIHISTRSFIYCYSFVLKYDTCSFDIMLQALIRMIGVSLCGELLF